MPDVDSTSSPPRWAKLIDQTLCIGCHACTTACKSENEVPLGVTRTYVKSVDAGVFPEARRAFQVTRCNQCDDAPCTTACPTGAMFRRPDGIVDFDKSICIGCKACIAACPYDAIFINPEDHSAEKCNFCAHRIDVGLEPACVVVCPTQAIVVGDLNDASSRLVKLVGRQPVAVRRPEKDTQPKLFYRGAHQSTLDPIAARRPDAGMLAWSEQDGRVGLTQSGHPGTSRSNGSAIWRGGANSSAAAVLSYDIGHSMPWDWRVSLYTWTKGIAAGAYLVPLGLVLAGAVPWTSGLWRWAAPVIAGIFLAATGGLLVWDLEHPDRFHMIFTRPQWRSWLVRGGFVIAAFAIVLFVHFVASLIGASEPQRVLAFAGAPLAVLTAVYTAYLFAQAKGRDLWQNPLAPVQLLVQAGLLGAAAMLGTVALFGDGIPDVVIAPPVVAGIAGANVPITAVAVRDIAPALLRVLTTSALLHLLLVLAETTLAHTTAHARLAAWEMTRGRYRVFFWSGVALVAAAAAAPWIGAWAVIPALAGVLAHEHAYVQAGQAVPLA